MKGVGVNVESFGSTTGRSNGNGLTRVFLAAFSSASSMIASLPAPRLSFSGIDSNFPIGTLSCLRFESKPVFGRVPCVVRLLVPCVVVLVMLLVKTFLVEPRSVDTLVLFMVSDPLRREDSIVANLPRAETAPGLGQGKKRELSAHHVYHGRDHEIRRATVLQGSTPVRAELCRAKVRATETRARCGLSRESRKFLLNGFKSNTSNRHDFCQISRVLENSSRSRGAAGRRAPWSGRSVRTTSLSMLARYAPRVRTASKSASA